MAPGRAGVAASGQRLLAGRLAGRYRVGAQVTHDLGVLPEEGRRVGGQAVLAAWTAGYDARRHGTGRRRRGGRVTSFLAKVQAAIEGPITEALTFETPDPFVGRNVVALSC